VMLLAAACAALGGVIAGLLIEDRRPDRPDGHLRPPEGELSSSA